MVKLSVGSSYLDFPGVHAAAAFARKHFDNLAWVIFNLDGTIAVASHKAAAFIG